MRAGRGIAVGIIPATPAMIKVRRDENCNSKIYLKALILLRHHPCFRMKESALFPSRGKVPRLWYGLSCCETRRYPFAHIQDLPIF